MQAAFHRPSTSCKHNSGNSLVKTRPLRPVGVHFRSGIVVGQKSHEMGLDADAAQPVLHLLRQTFCDCSGENHTARWPRLSVCHSRIHFANVALGSRGMFLKSNEQARLMQRGDNFFPSLVGRVQPRFSGVVFANFRPVTYM